MQFEYQKTNLRVEQKSVSKRELFLNFVRFSIIFTFVAATLYVAVKNLL